MMQSARFDADFESVLSFGTGECDTLVLERLSRTCEELSAELMQSWGCMNGKTANLKVPKLPPAAEEAVNSLLLQSPGHLEGVLAGKNPPTFIHIAGATAYSRLHC